MTMLNRSLIPTTMLIVLVALIASAMYPTIVSADGEDIRIVSEKVESIFPEGVSFQLEATSPSPIEEVRVFLKPVGSERSTYGYLDIVPGTEVKGEYEMVTGQGTNHLPPGTVIRYSFEISDVEGQVLRTDDREFLYLDGSLKWQEITEGLLTVYYYGEFVENRARNVLAAAQRTIDEMGPVLGATPDKPIRVVSYSNYRDMARALPFRSQSVREGLITEGQAWPIERVVLVLSSDPDFIGVASHELTHILVADATKSGYLSVPAWLNEGLAEFGNQDQTESYDRALAYGIFTRRLKPLWYLTAFGGGPDDITIAYGQSRSVVRYVIARYGPEKMAQFMGALRNGLAVDPALEQVYGFDQYGLDSEWRLSLRLPPFPPPDQLERDQASRTGQDPEPVEDQTETDDISSSDQEEQPTPLSEATQEVPATEALPATADEGSEETERSSGSCSAPGGGAGSVPIQFGMLALLGSPFLFFPFKWSLRQVVRRKKS